jgi:hypothetical protein
MTQIEIAHKLAKDAELDQKKADAIIQAIAEYTQSVAPVSREYLDKRLAELESSLHRWIVGTGGAILIGIAGIAIAAVNFLAAHYKP